MDESGKSHAKKLVAARTGRDLEGLLRELYVEKRYSQREIGRHLEVHRLTVGAWLDEFGITREDRAPLEPIRGTTA